VAKANKLDYTDLTKSGQRNIEIPLPKDKRPKFELYDVGGGILSAIAANKLFNPQTTQANQLFDNQSHGMLADSYNKPPRKLDDLSSIDSIQAGHGSMGNQLQNWTGRQLSKLQKNIPALSMLTDIDDIAKLNRKSLQGEEVTSEDKYRAIPGLSGAYDVKDLYNHFFN
jgi:hypothetical protein